MTPDQIDAGILALFDPSREPWPPGALEFRQLCLPPPAPTEWQPSPGDRADPAKMPGPKRVQWHLGNVAHVKAGGELPRDVIEPEVHE